MPSLHILKRKLCQVKRRGCDVLCKYAEVTGHGVTRRRNAVMCVETRSANKSRHRAALRILKRTKAAPFVFVMFYWYFGCGAQCVFNSYLSRGNDCAPSFVSH